MNKFILALLVALGHSGIAHGDSLAYTNDFEVAEVDSVPDGMMVLAGDFSVKSDGTNRFLELPGAPLDSFAVQFGPGGKDLSVITRIRATKKGRRMPTFGVGLGGVSGWKLQVAPAKDAVELLKDQETKASVGYAWKSGEWVHLRLSIYQGETGDWKITGKVWRSNETEPKMALISFTEKDEPVSGRASIIASPFSGMPIWFDDLVVEKSLAE